MCAHLSYKNITEQKQQQQQQNDKNKTKKNLSAPELRMGQKRQNQPTKRKKKTCISLTKCSRLMTVRCNGKCIQFTAQKK